MCSYVLSYPTCLRVKPSAVTGSIRRSTFLAVTCFALWLAASVSPLAHAQTNEWAWMGGSSTLPLNPPVWPYGQPGVYGSPGVADAANIPGGRVGAVSWTDSQGNFWLFGGNGFDSTHTSGYLNDLWKFNPTTRDWTWVSGSSTVPSTGQGQPGIYGALLTPAAGNTPGGRSGALGWTDAHGNLWLLGGAGYDSTGTEGELNDLWEYNIPSGQWAWMGGVSVLGPSGSVAGVYGPLGSLTSGSFPGSHNTAVTWTDNFGNLWFFGGWGDDALNRLGYMNDLWKFVPSTGQWAWMGGSSTNGGAGWSGVYGSLGTAAAGNTPGAREDSTGWFDSSGNLWLFGGYGYASTPNGDVTNGYLNDVWEFSPATNEWTWMGGSGQFPNSCASGPHWGCGAAGVYGLQGETSAANIPGSREVPVVWLNSGNVWLMGGEGYDSTGNTVYYLNDLWEFSPQANQWTWVGGPSTIGDGSDPGVYGALGTPSPENTPGGRFWGVSWTALDGSFWLEGGTGLDAKGNVGYLNDVWEYQTAIAPATLPPPTFLPPAGTYTSIQTVAISDAIAGATIYYTTDGTTPTTDSMVYTGPITVSVSETIEAYAAAGGFTPSSVSSASYIVNIPVTATPTFDPPAGTYSSSQTVTISDTPGATIYYAINAIPTTSSTPYTGPITVSTSETIEAIAVASGSTQSAVGSASYTISPISNFGNPSFTLSLSPNELTVNSGGSGVSTVTVAPLNGFNSAVSFACSGLPAGATCTFSPATVTPSGNPVNAQLTISYTALARLEHKGKPWVPGSTLALATCLLLFRRRKNWRLSAILVAVALGAGVLSGCATVVVYTIPSTSTVTVTATSGVMQQTAQLTLTAE